MDTHRGEFRIGTMCEVLGVSRSGSYAWRRRPRSQRDEANARITETIRPLHDESRGI
jgi:putative transposase